MAVIGTLLLNMKARAEGLQKGAKAARKTLGSIVDSVTSTQAALAGLGSAIGTGVAVSAFTEMAKAQAENIAYTTRLADRIGTTTEELSGLQYAAKHALGTDDIEAFGDALSDMQEKIGDVTLEEGGAKDILAMAGLDAEAMAKQDAVENFKQIADAIAGMQSKAEKLHVLDTMFGGEGQKMLPLLEQGSAGIEEMQARAKELGLTFNELQGGQVLAAQQAIGDLTARFEGLAAQVALQVAPFITALLDKLESFGPIGVTASEVVATGIGWVATGLGIVADVIDVVMDAFSFLKSGATKILAWIADAIWGLAKALEYVINLIPGMEVSFTETLDAVRNDLHKLAGEQFDEAMSDFMAAPPSEAIESFFNDIQKSSEAAANSIGKVTSSMEGTTAATMRLGQKIAELEKSLRDQLETFGMSSTEAEIYRLELEGATYEQLKNARAIAAQLKEREELQKLEDKAKEIFEQTRTPFEQVKEEVAELMKLRDMGLLDDDTFNRALMQAKEKLGETPEIPAAGVAELGSAEARSTILRNQFGGSDPWTEQLKTGRDSLKEQREQTRLLRQMASDGGDVFTF
jgi:hypothetical protein